MISVIPADESYLTQLGSLEKECFSTPLTEKQLLAQLRGQQYKLLLAVESDRTLCGYVGLMHVLDEGNILNLAVGEQFRRRGIADCIMDALETTARELQLSFLTLEVRETNMPALALYIKHGYENVGLRKNYYKNPTENALLLTKYLK